MYSRTIDDDVASPNTPSMPEPLARTAAWVSATLSLMVGLVLLVVGLTMGLTVMLVLLGLTPFALGWAWFVTRGRRHRDDDPSPPSSPSATAAIVGKATVPSRTADDDGRP